MPSSLVDTRKSGAACVLALLALACGSEDADVDEARAGTGGSTSMAGSGGSSASRGGSGGSTAPEAGAGGGAGSGATAGTQALCNVTDAFGEAMGISELNTENNDRGPRLTSDERTIVFSRDGVVYLAERENRNATFGEAEPQMGLGSSTYPESAPWISDDGLTLFFEIQDLNDVNMARRLDRAGDFIGGSWVTEGRDPYVVGGANGVLYVTRLNMGIFAAPLTNWQPGDFVLAAPDDWDRPVVSSDQLTMYTFSGLLKFSQRASTDELFESWNDVPGLEDYASNFWPSWLSPDACRLYLDGPLTLSIDLTVAERSPP